MALWSRVTARLGLSGGHLGDEELLALLLPAGSEPSSAATRAHLDRCEMCTDRSMMLQAFLSGLMETSEATLAETFPLDRLATQRERIMRRLRRSVEPARRGRVLSFPALARPALAGVHRAHRWLGATAAAGLLIGVTVGHFLHIHPELAEPAQPTTVTAGMPVTPAMASQSRRLSCYRHHHHTITTCCWIEPKMN